MMLRLLDLVDFLLLSSLVPIPLFPNGELDAELKGIATSQKDLVTSDGASISGSKIVEASLGASMDINSTQ